MRRPSLVLLALLSSVLLVACGGDDAPDDPDASQRPDSGEPDASEFRCGNGTIDPGEDCEQGDLGGQDCGTQGFDDGTLFCNLDCSFDTALCSSDSCGDDAVDGTDVCDGSDLAGATCASQGFQPGGTLTCNVNCDGYITTDCTPLTCGDGDVDAGELCDGAALNNQTCVTRGFASGTLACGATCQVFDTSGCVPSVCGNNTVETGEGCDDGNTVDGDGCEGDCQLPGGPVVTVCQTLAPLPGGETCQVTAGSASKLITGDILTPGEVFKGGQVLIDAAGVIQCTGCNCAELGAGATQISCPTGVVSPGLINTHDHITFTQNSPYTATDERYEHRHDWRRGSNGHTRITSAGSANGAQVSWGELRFLMGGATSIVGSGSANGLLRNLDRSAQEGLGQPQVNFETFPLDDSSGTQRDGDCNYGSGADTESVFNTIDAYEPHISEGISRSARNEFLCTSGTTFDTTAPGIAHDLVNGESAFIHGTGLRAADYALMGVEGTALIWSPRSNITLYGDTAQVSTADRLGVLIALGTDWTPTGSMNMLRELRCADEFNTTYLDGHFDDEDLWMMATQNAASVTATDDVIGRLAVGLVADVAIFDGAVNSEHRAVIAAEPEDVVLVIRGGKPLYGDATVVAAIPASGACDVVDVCGDQKRVCLMSEVNMTYSQLQTAANSYAAFFCATPTNEPSCVPERTRTTAPMASVNGSTVYDGIPDATDADGDGIADGVDNCPSVFNPIRPLDDGAQADHDNDGAGDPCDVCPINANTTTCTPPDPNDGDGDGVANATDNCPAIANTDQADFDMDSKGDVCDPCPMDANPGTAACPGTIYDVKDGSLPVGSSVRITSAIVTGRYASGFFLQTKPGDPGYLGADHSGVFVYAPGNTVAEGDRVTISAGIQDFFGQIQLASATSIAVTASGEALPAPIAVTVAEVVTGGSRAAALEGVLVQVVNVTVASLDASFNEFLVDVTPPGAGADLRVDDLMFLPTPFPAVNDFFTSITGVLNFRNANSKLEPRRAADLVAGLAIASFGPTPTFVTAGQTNVPTVPTPLTVTMNTPVATDTFVAITSGDPTSLTVVGGGVTILAGQTSAPVRVNGLVQSAAVTLTATFNTQMLTATVRVLGAGEMPTTLTLTPATANLASNGTLTLTATLDIPAPIAGLVVTLNVNPSGAGAVPPTLVFASGELTRTFDYVDNGSVVGAIVVTATAGALTDSTTITTSTSVVDHLVINEIDYDQAATDMGEYIEIFNGTGAPVSLSGVLVILVNGSNNTEYARYDLSTAGASLPNGGYLLVKNAGVPANGALSVTLTDNTLQNGAPDGIVLVVGGVAVDAISYEGTMPNVTLTGVSAPVVFTGLTLVDDATAEVLVRTPNGTDTDAAADWVLGATLTPGTVNP